MTDLQPLNKNISKNNKILGSTNYASRNKIACAIIKEYVDKRVKFNLEKKQNKYVITGLLNNFKYQFPIESFPSDEKINLIASNVDVPFLWIKFILCKITGLKNNLNLTGPEKKEMVLKIAKEIKNIDSSNNNGNQNFTNSNGNFTNPNGNFTNPNGNLTNPNGNLANSNGNLTNPNGNLTKLDENFMNLNENLVKLEKNLAHLDEFFTNPESQNLMDLESQNLMNPESQNFTYLSTIFEYHFEESVLHIGVRDSTSTFMITNVDYDTCEYLANDPNIKSSNISPEKINQFIKLIFDNKIKNDNINPEKINKFIELIFEQKIKNVNCNLEILNKLIELNFKQKINGKVNQKEINNFILAAFKQKINNANINSEELNDFIESIFQ
jgi:hypothetical protein